MLWTLGSGGIKNPCHLLFQPCVDGRKRPCCAWTSPNNPFQPKTAKLLTVLLIACARGEAKHLADGHKMALLRKVLRTFNTGAGVRVNGAERLARKVDQHVVLRDQVRVRAVWVRIACGWAGVQGGPARVAAGPGACVRCGSSVG